MLQNKGNVRLIYTFTNKGRYIVGTCEVKNTLYKTGRKINQQPENKQWWWKKLVL